MTRSLHLIDDIPINSAKSLAERLLVKVAVCGTGKERILETSLVLFTCPFECSEWSGILLRRKKQTKQQHYRMLTLQPLEKLRRKSIENLNLVKSRLNMNGSFGIKRDITGHACASGYLCFSTLFSHKRKWSAFLKECHFKQCKPYASPKHIS